MPIAAHGRSLLSRRVVQLNRMQSLASAAMSSEPASGFADVLRRFGLGDEDLAAWQDSKLPVDAFEEWLTDRVARRPAGSRAREVYGAEDIHDFARRAILDALALKPGDRLLDVGCGGGLLLRDARSSGASVAGLDHSEEMVLLARERAPGATVILGAAEQLPFEDDSFTAIAMSIVLLFLPHPVAVSCECHRVLAPGGRIAVYTSSPALRGTPAAPEPLAGRSHFYENEKLAELARQAGFADVVVVNDGGGQLSRRMPNNEALLVARYGALLVGDLASCCALASIWT